MTIRTITTCDFCQRELEGAQHLVVTTRGSRIVGPKHLCDFACMEKWAPKAAKAEKDRTAPISALDWKPVFAPILPSWEQQHGPFCSTCGCGGNWHYSGCAVGKARGDTHFVRKVDA